MRLRREQRADIGKHYDADKIDQRSIFNDRQCSEWQCAQILVREDY